MSHASLRTWSTVAIAGVAAVILVLTLGPWGTGDGDGGEECAFGLPCVLGHFGLFALLGVALAVRFATSEAARRSPARAMLAVLFGLWLFAAVDEIAQGYVDRDPQLEDWLADMAGALVGFFGAGFVARALAPSMATPTRDEGPRDRPHPAGPAPRVAGRGGGRRRRRR